jgi:transcriptional regulator with XRE-family HTH domain
MYGTLMDNKEYFRTFLVRWMAENWMENQSAFAEFLGISRHRLSNILNGYKGTSEEARIAICNRLGVDYRTLIQTDSVNADKGQVIIPAHPVDLRLASMQANLLAIYKSGDATKISAIETNLSSLRATIQMEKRARKKVALSLMEEEESLVDPPAIEKPRGKLA